MARIPIKLDNRIRIPVVELDDYLQRKLCAEFSHKNPERGKMKALGRYYEHIPETIDTYKLDDQELSFPRGGLERVRDVLKTEGENWAISDERTQAAWWKQSSKVIPDQTRELRDYQVELIDALVKGEQGIGRAPTGSGKTSAALGLISKLNVPSLVLVPNTTIYEQWVERVEEELDIPKNQVGLIKSSTFRLAPVTIASPMTLCRYTPEKFDVLNNYFDLVLADEAQLFAANSFYTSIDSLSFRYRFAVSADETRKDRKDFLIYDLFGNVLSEISKKRLVEDNYIHDVTIKVIPTDFKAEWYGVSFGDDEEKRAIDFNRLLEQMSTNGYRESTIRHLIQAAVAEGEVVVALTHRVEHALSIGRDVVAMGIKSGTIIGGDDNRLEFRRTITGMKAGEIKVGVGTYQASGTGLDVPCVTVGIATTPLASNKQKFGQFCGRICRASASTGKKKATLMYVWDQHVYPKHLDNLRKWNKNVVVLHENTWMPVDEYQAVMEVA